MSDVEAIRFADDVRGLVEEPVEFLTNVEQKAWPGLVDRKKLMAWTSEPLTDVTFSTGVALVGPDEAAVLVVSDED